MRYVSLKKEKLGDVLRHIGKKHRVVAPVKKENQFVFADITDIHEVSLEYKPTILPPKKYFFPQKEKLGSFNMGDTAMKDVSVESVPTVIFGAHTCDIDGMECLEAVFYHDPADPYYKKRRKSLIVVGYECMFPCDEYATCVTMDTHMPKAGYDIMITDAGSKYILHINSSIGDSILENAPSLDKTDEAALKEELKKLRDQKFEKFKVKLEPFYKELPELFDKSYNSPVWDSVGKKCVSCGNCTAVCPTCYCFDIQDEMKLDMTGGDRLRMWDSCQLDEFATVAGGENFRKKRASRQKHRYYRKFSYPVKKYHKFFCTGCGRCTRACVAKISLIETLNELKKGDNNV